MNKIILKRKTHMSHHLKQYLETKYVFDNLYFVTLSFAVAIYKVVWLNLSKTEHVIAPIAFP